MTRHDDTISPQSINALHKPRSNKMRKTEIKIKRENGDIEIVDVSAKFPGGISDPMFDQIKKATKAAGKGDCLSYSVTNIDTRADAEKDYDLTVGKAMSELCNAREANYQDPARIIKARSALEAAKKSWGVKHPEAATKRAKEEKKEEDQRHEEIQNSAGYKAAIEGRD